jgi:hypothetical protein
MLDLEHVIGPALDGVGNRVAVRGAGGQRAEDEQVERALQQLAFDRRLSSSRHRNGFSRR